MPLVLNFLSRTVLLLAGAVFAACLLVLFVAILAVGALRAGWALLTGRPVTPFVMRSGARRMFDDMLRRARRPQPSARAPRTHAAPRGRVLDVTDVEPK